MSGSVERNQSPYTNRDHLSNLQQSMVVKFLDEGVHLEVSLRELAREAGYEDYGGVIVGVLKQSL